MEMKQCAVCGSVKAGYLFQLGSDECDVCRAVRMGEEAARAREEAERAYRK